MTEHNELTLLNENQIKKVANEVYNYLQPYCIAIYLGGSLCENIIDNSHDVDFICFSDEPINMNFIRMGLHFYQKTHNLPENYDFIQVRTKQREEHSYGSYINKKMIKLIGEDIEFNFDIINKDRKEYIKILQETKNQLLSNRIKNQKRWYQLLRGSYILINNSYDLTNEQKREINILHDLAEGWKELKDKTCQLIEKLS